MVTTLERGAPTSAFTETISEFPERPSDTLAFAHEPFEAEADWPGEPVRAWLRAYLATLVQEVDRLHGEVQRMVREIPRLMEFRRAVRELLRGPANHRKDKRREIIQRIRSSQLPRLYVQEVLRECSTGGGPDSLDIGIDILSQTGPLALEFAQDFLPRDAQRWSPTPTIAHHLHDDFWDILLRAAARATPDRPETLGLIRSCARAGNRGLRDAVILALYDLGTQDARTLLAEMAQNDDDAMIRHDAQELLEDLRS
jgi:hypothetical protein